MPTPVSETRMDGFLTKPVRLDALRDEVARTLGGPLAAPDAAPPGPPALGAGGEAPPPPAVPSPPAVAAHLRALCDGDGALAAEILGAYLGTEAALTADLAGPDPAGAAHKLRAACGTLGADGLAHALFAAESAARAGDLGAATLARLGDDLAALRTSAEAARDLLAAVAPAR